MREVIVLGAGMVGVASALHLQRRGWSVAVLETRRIAWNASGRNDGFVLPESAVIMEYLEERYPEPALLAADPGQRAATSVSAAA